MSIYPYLVQFTPGGQQVFLRELCGHDELAVEDTGTIGAIQLLNRLLVDYRGEPHQATKAEILVTADRDRLLATVYKQTFGTLIDSTITCQACAQPFDINFSLDALIAHHQSETKPTTAKRLDDGTFRLDDSCRFRLPSGEDELAILQVTPNQAEEMLLRRCLLEGELAAYGAQIQEEMEKLAPVLQTDMQAVCPECNRQQTLHFDVQSFLLTRLQKSRRQVVGQVHRLATTYRWSHREILDLPRRLRHMYVSFIESENSQYRFP